MEEFPLPSLITGGHGIICFRTGPSKYDLGVVIEYFSKSQIHHSCGRHLMVWHVHIIQYLSSPERCVYTDLRRTIDAKSKYSVSNQKLMMIIAFNLYYKMHIYIYILPYVLKFLPAPMGAVHVCIFIYHTNHVSMSQQSMGWLKGKSTGNHRCSHEIWDFPVFFP